jgi:hypothetical protein
MAETAHYCHEHKCRTPVTPRLFACRRHWLMLPLNLRHGILNNYRKGQEIDKKPSLAYIKAAHAAMLFLAKKEHPGDVEDLKVLYADIESAWAERLARAA